MFSSILAASDFSDASRNAVYRAARLARQTNAALHVVHVAQPSPLDQLRTVAGDDDLPRRLVAAARFQLDELVDAVRRDYGVVASAHLTEGSMPDEIEAAQRATAADLTVLGARGTSVARHHLLGTTAERLLAGAQHPILVVRLAAEVTWRRALVPVDFSDGCLVALQRTRALAPAASVTLLHAWEALYEGKMRTAGVESTVIRRHREESESRARQEMAAFLARTGDPAPMPRILHGNPLVHTLDQEEETGAQLVVVGKGSGSRLEDFVFGSLSRRVLLQSRVDVLLSAGAP